MCSLSIGVNNICDLILNGGGMDVFHHCPAELKAAHPTAKPPTNHPSGADPMSNKTSCRYAFPSLLAAVLFCALFGVQVGSVFAQDNPPANTVCLDCHDDRATSLDGTAHSLSGGKGGGTEARIACVDCHEGDRRHWEDDPDQYAMTNPSKVKATTEARLCSKCHQNAHQQNMLEKNIHVTNDVNCSACHSVHESKHTVLLKKAEPGLCFSCHQNAEGRFAKPYRHPVSDGIVKCSDCHMALDETRRELSLNGTNMCTKCHAEFEGPFPYEHQATVDYSTEEGGCISCHDPHGSYLPRMLKQPYEAPHFQLCSQCHSVPGHNSNVEHGTRWSGVPCNDCHTDIHGSYSNRLFVSESLKGQGCFNAGCHQL